MLARILIAVTLCLAACAASRAEAVPADLPIVLGEADGGPPMADDVVIIEEGVPTEPAASGVVRDEELPLDGLPTPTVSCTDAPPAGWDRFTTVDVLFMQRSNTVGPLAVESQAGPNGGAPVIAAGDLRYPTFPGLRIFQGWRGPDCSGFEVGYLGVWSMSADAAAGSPDALLALPGQLGLVTNSGLDSATAIAPTLAGTLNSLEFNVFATRVHDGCRRNDPLPWRRSWDVLADTVVTADWLLGIRWAGLDETATLDVTAANAVTTGYRVTTSSHLLGPQIGHRRRIEWDAWAFEGWAKAALAASMLDQSQGAVIGPFDAVQIRPPRSSSFAGVGMIGDLNATVVRRLGDHWGVRAGYTLLWLAGVAPAANQWDFSDTPTSGTRLDPGSVFIHGATLGLEAAW